MLYDKNDACKGNNHTQFPFVIWQIFQHRNEVNFVILIQQSKSVVYTLP